MMWGGKICYGKATFSLTWSDPITMQGCYCLQYKRPAQRTYSASDNTLRSIGSDHMRLHYIHIGYQFIISVLFYWIIDKYDNI